MIQDRARGKASKEGKVDRTLKSYLLQEAEATSREAKIRWCEERGLAVTSLQHDGIFISNLADGMSLGDTEDELSRVATEACGFEVVVKGKKIGYRAEQDGVGDMRVTLESMRTALAEKTTWRKTRTEKL